MTDVVADMITRIRNGQRACLVSVKSPYSKFREAVLKVIRDEGYIDSFTVSEMRKGIKEMDIVLKYTSNGQSVIQDIRKISKPGRRNYTNVHSMNPVYNNMGIAILSTPLGVMSDHEARKKNVGGEMICQIF